jgi:hypothetical protein
VDWLDADLSGPGYERRCGECPVTATSTVAVVAHPTDLTDAQWRLVRDLFDPSGRRGAPARIPRRRMVSAMLHQARTGGQWRFLPGHFGPWGATWQQFRR